MASTLGEYVKTADWKAEKHVPVITAPQAAKAGEWIDVEVEVGKEIAHPNTAEHYIAWIALYFVADGAPVPVELGRSEFSAHGTGAITAPSARFKVQLSKSGTLFAQSYCNLHGLWESAVAIVEA